MNIHPAFVHFPIALLLLYALIELLPVRRYLSAVAWDHISRFLLYVGTLAGAVTAATGLMAADIVGETPAVESHEGFALTLVGIAIVTSALTYFWRSESVLKNVVMKLLPLTIFLMLFIVGSLGANIVYGNDVDPIVRFVTTMLGLNS